MTEIQSEEDPRKIFVGNLDFKVKDDELAGYFTAIGKVEKAHVITRGTRSLGYGFVTFENEADAIAAFNKLNKQDFNGREINIEIAKPRNPNAPPAGRRGGYRGGFRGGRGGRGRFYNDFYGGFGYEQRGFGFRGGRGGFRGGRGRRGGRLVSERKTGEPSKNTLFIANLPFSLNDETLLSLFDGEYKVASAHVVTLRNGRSKGYGFVEFETEDDQKRALLDKNNLIVDGRPLALKIALNIPEENAPEESAQ